MGVVLAAIWGVLPVEAFASYCGKIRTFETRIGARFPKSSPNLINCGPGSEGASNYSLPTDPEAPFEMHIVGIYDGSFPPEPGKRGGMSRERGVQVLVYKTLKPAVLVLSSAKPVRWEITVNKNAVVELVILQGRYQSKMSGLPAGIPVLRRDWKKSCSWTYGWEREFNRRGGHYKRMIQSLRCATGLRESSFQGCKVGAVFEIPHVKQQRAQPGLAFPQPCPLDLEPEFPLGNGAAQRIALRPAPPRAMDEKSLLRKRSPAPKTRDPYAGYDYAPETLADPRVPSMRGDIKAYADAHRFDDTAKEAASLPAPRRSMGKPETLPAPKINSARGDIPIRALAILLEGNTALLTHDAIPDLLTALKRGGEKLRSRAADALGQLRPPPKRAIKPLIHALKDPSDRVRSSAALALGNIGPDAEKSVRLLKRALRDRNADVRYSAETALERIGTRKALKALGKRRRR
ncbi:MAG: hypothetical protein COB53_08240 [Elusimicrobia bacterium]|nr:MAG: hypothetical protein COB53_08240 [Elusimicrobiota bacterium]